MTYPFSSLAVYYITGTGNAASAAGWVADEAIKAGIPASVTDIAADELDIFASCP